MVNGIGLLSRSRNLGSENQVDMIIPMSSYASTSLLYRLTRSPTLCPPSCLRAHSRISFFGMLFLRKNAIVAVNKAVAP